MNNQFATQFLLEELDEFESLRSMLSQLGASEDSIEVLVNAVAKGHIEPSKAVDIIKATAMHEDGMGGGSTTGGGVTNGASFTPGNGEQYAMGTKKVRKTLGETTVGQHFDLDVKSERGDGSIQRYQLKNVKLVNSNERVFEKPDGTTVILSPSDKYTATKVGNLDENTSETTLKVGDKVEYENQEWEIVNFLTNGNVRLKSLKGLPSTNVMPDKIKKIKTEDAPRLAGEPSKTDSQGTKNLSAYKSVGFTKAPSAEAAGKKLKSIDVEELWEGSVPENIAKFAKKKGISSMVSKIAGWAEKAGKKVTGGTAIGKNYDTLVLDLGYQDSAIYINIPEEAITVYDQPVSNYNSFVAALEQKDEPLNENYFRFRNETKTRSKPEQYHQAVKTITKKLDEVNRLLEFTGTLKTELSEGEDAFEVKHNTKKAMYKVRGKVVEAYKKLKQL